MTKTALLTGAAMAALLISCTALPADSNNETVKVENSVDASIANKPMLAEWSGSYDGVPPWGEVKASTFEANLIMGLEMAQAEYDAIAKNPEPATFENTILAMERAGEPLSRASSIFGVHASNLANDEIRGIQTRMSPKFSAFSDGITQNEKLFARVKAVYENMEAETLNPIQKRLVTERYLGFVRQGANLNDEDKAQLTAINSRLSSLTTQFGQNVQADEEKYTTVITDENDLAGLPDWLVTSMAAQGADNEWVVTNTRSSMDPFLTYSSNRQLREEVWNKYYNRGDNGDANDNNAIITEILTLRQQRAELLGYESHAHWALEDRMAKTPQNAIDLMETVWPAAVARANEEIADMQSVADTEGANITIKPWDYRYYAEKVRKDKYDLDFNLVKPYLQMEKLREGMFYAAGRLYDFEFEQVTDVPVYHPDVRVWKVMKDGDLQGLWYFDPYARTGKRSGAWMNALRTQHRMDGKDVKVIVTNNSNFVKGVEGEPTLISWDDANTMFHEFGHALHGLNSNVTYPGQSGTAVARDYVEFPSQLNEHWLETPEVLNTYAVHYETGEPIPQDLLDKMKNAETFNQGFSTVEYLASALVDMKLHMAEGEIDPDAFERETLAELGMPSAIVMRHRTPHFGHIFAGGYSAGYYSYLWSDTLTADSAEAFEEAGSFYDEAVAKSLYENIMSVGDTVDPADGFRAFRGRDVSIAPLMRKRGFPVPKDME
ncbi:M3 family metallopeptidase [Robiginitomaculum antarcticum]|uniref:M3 family metallopeptidase n=1 Tax=Robiginitomaculum antarcticum TaxID=437507 RepID=UPI000399DD9C|nr:M3 family metallopeptidase [Robiginitomaculum antarcticum]